MILFVLGHLRAKAKVSRYQKLAAERDGVHQEWEEKHRQMVDRHNRSVADMQRDFSEKQAGSISIVMHATPRSSLTENAKIQGRSGTRLASQNCSDHGGPERSQPFHGRNRRGFCFAGRIARFWGLPPLPSKSQEARSDHGCKSLQLRDFTADATTAH